MFQKYNLLWGLRAVCVALISSAVCGAPAIGRPLDLRTALLHSQPSAPGIASARARVRAAGAAIEQAGRLPNPSLAIEVENFGGSGPYARFGQNETTASYQQKIELGGKREARTEAARAAHRIAEVKRLIQTLDFFKDVEEAWVNALADSAKLNLTKQQATDSDALVKNVSRRVAAARDPLFAGAQAEARKAQVEVLSAYAQSAAQTSRAVLATYVPDQPAFELDPALLSDLSLPAIGDEGPDIALLDAERLAAATRVSLARAQAVPDPQVQLGVRRFEANSDYAVVAGVSMPIPIFDANSGNIARAGEERSAAEGDLAAARLSYKRDTTRLSQKLGAYVAEVHRLETDIVPQTARALSLVKSGYARGGFTYRDVADAQRLHIEVQNQRIEALRNFHLQRAALRRLTGEHTALVSTPEVSR